MFAVQHDSWHCFVHTFVNIWDSNSMQEWDSPEMLRSPTPVKNLWSVCRTEILYAWCCAIYSSLWAVTCYWYVCWKEWVRYGM